MFGFLVFGGFKENALLLIQIDYSSNTNYKTIGAIYNAYVQC